MTVTRQNKSDLEQYDRRYFFRVTQLIAFVLFSLFIAVNSMDETTRIGLIKESGPIENLTAAYYFIVVFILFVKGGWKFFKKYPHLIILAGALGLRELDFNARFTTMSIWKIKFYLSANVPLTEKVIGVLVTVVILYFLIVCIKKHLRSFIAKCTRETESMFIGLSLLFMTLAFLLDKMPDFLVNLGTQMTRRFPQIAQSMEEILELGAPFALIVSALAYFSKPPAGGGSVPLRSGNPQQ